MCRYRLHESADFHSSRSSGGLVQTCFEIETPRTHQRLSRGPLPPANGGSLNCTVVIVPLPTFMHTGLNSGGGGGFSVAGSHDPPANTGADILKMKGMRPPMALASSHGKSPGCLHLQITSSRLITVATSSYGQTVRYIFSYGHRFKGCPGQIGILRRPDSDNFLTFLVFKASL
jgi:hypothetical protein